jgi:hypothetical protein
LASLQKTVVVKQYVRFLKPNSQQNIITLLVRVYKPGQSGFEVIVETQPSYWIGLELHPVGLRWGWGKCKTR